MISNLYWQSVFKWYHSNKHFSQFYPQDGGEIIKPASIDMERNYVIVTLCIHGRIKLVGGPCQSCGGHGPIPI